MKWNPYLMFNGQCEAAFKFYADCLGGKIESIIPHAGTPAEEHVPLRAALDDCRVEQIVTVRERFGIAGVEDLYFRTGERLPRMTHRGSSVLWKITTFEDNAAACAACDRASAV